MPEPIAQRSLSRALAFHRRNRQFRRARHAHDGSRILRAGPSLVFVRAAVLQSLDRQPCAEVQHARAFRSVKFMSCGRNKMNI